MSSHIWAWVTKPEWWWSWWVPVLWEWRRKRLQNRMQSWRRSSAKHGRTEPWACMRGCVCLSVVMAGGKSLRSQLLVHLNSAVRLNTALLETGTEEGVKEVVFPSRLLSISVMFGKFFILIIARFSNLQNEEINWTCVTNLLWGVNEMILAWLMVSAY